MTNGSGSESRKFVAHLVRSQVMELREGTFLFLKMRLGKNFRTKKRSFGQFLIQIRIQDSDPDSNPGFESGIRIRIRIRSESETNFRRFGSETGSVSFVSDPQHWKKGFLSLTRVLLKKQSNGTYLAQLNEKKKKCLFKQVGPVRYPLIGSPSCSASLRMYGNACKNIQPNYNLI